MRKEIGMSRDLRRNRKLFSFSLVMIIFLASLTTLFVVVPFNAKAEDANAVPTNGAPSYGGWDMGDPKVFPGDNCYAQYREYTITVVYSDKDGYADFNYVELCIGEFVQEPETTRTTFRYDEDTDIFSQISDGQEKWDLDSTSKDVSEGSPTPDDITVTWRFKPQWDADEESDLEIKLYCCDDQPTSDTDVHSPNFDVVTTLLTNDIESQLKGKPDDRVDLSSGVLEMVFEVRYVDEPGSKTPQSSFYPPASELKEVFLFRVAEGGELLETPEQEGSIAGEEMEGGGGIIDFNVPANVNIHGYRLQVSMVDKDYGEGGVGWLTNLDETVITDRIEITSQEASEAGNRINVNTGVTYAVQARLDYDNHAVGEGDSLTATCGALEWDGGKWVKEGYSKSSAGDLTFSVSSGNEATYGIAAIYDTAPDPGKVIWDEILVNWSANQYTVDAGTEVTITLDDVIYDYDNANVGSYQYDVHETFCDQDNGLIKDDYGSSSFTVTPMIAGFYNYTIPSLSESEYGLTANQTNQTISLTVKQSISLVNNSKNNGVNYITWGVNDSLMVSTLATALNLQEGDTIGKFNTATGNWSDIEYIAVVDTGDFQINRWDYVQITVKDNRSHSFTPDGSVGSSQQKTMTFNSTNEGYSYITWTNDFTITAEDFAAKLGGAPGVTGENVAINVYNPTTGETKNYNPSVPPIFQDNFNIQPYDVISFKAPTSHGNIDYNADDYL